MEYEKLLMDTSGNGANFTLNNIPSFSSTTLIQALGRIHRAESKSIALQIYCAHYRRSHMQQIKRKIKIPIKIK